MNRVSSVAALTGTLPRDSSPLQLQMKYSSPAREEQVLQKTTLIEESIKSEQNLVVPMNETSKEDS